MLALVHEVGEAIARCELTFLRRQPIDPARARAQHAAYCELLRACGARVHVLAVSPGLPDAVFVEDAAVVLDEVAVAAAMRPSSRRAEVENLLPVLRAHRPVVRIPAPGFLEGGDVLRLGRSLYVGLSARTDAGGASALPRAVVAYGYRVVPVPVRGCLHLKTACTALDAATILVNPEWVDARAFPGLRSIEVPPDEPFAANVLRVGATLCLPSRHRRTRAMLERAGYQVRTVDISELEKAEAGMTCLSLLLDCARAAS
jgi:dimethylargininase